MFEPDEYQLKALKTWYQHDNPLYLNPRHPCIKLAGEAGEILDLYGKHEYKPGVNWLDCKTCGQSQDDIFHGQEKYSHEYIPKIFDELGDYSYYLRILAYQRQIVFEELCAGCNVKENLHIPIEKLLSELNICSANVLGDFVASNYVYEHRLMICTYYFLAILAKLNVSLEQVLELNYKKLSSEPTAHGWKNAR